MLENHVLTLTLGLLCAAAWVYIVAFRGAFWMTWRYHDLSRAGALPGWPQVVAVIPARDEAEGVGDTVRSLLAQDYSGKLSIILVDDHSSDGTAEVARKAADEAGAPDRLTVISGEALPAGWTGKLWAVRQGVARAETMAVPYLLLTDADISYDRDVVARLVTHAQARNLVLTSVMARLRKVSFAERVLVPAFVYFFQLLYPFSWVRKPDSSTAAAAGGCMLIRADALRASGGIDAIRGALIDDCTMAAQLKRQGRVWLGFCDGVRSTRVYDSFAEVGRMISRSAYAQLRYSPLILLGTLLGLTLVFLVPIGLLFSGSVIGFSAGIAIWIAMARTYLPTLRDYESGIAWSLALPVIALIYMGFTVSSAWQHMRGRGGMWKGRAQAQAVRSS